MYIGTQADLYWFVSGRDSFTRFHILLEEVSYYLYEIVAFGMRSIISWMTVEERDAPLPFSTKE